MSQLERIYTDLLNVEVNTIIKRDINGNAMPSLPFAFLDIIECYARRLHGAGVDIGPYFAPTRAQLSAQLPALYAKRNSDPKLGAYFSTAHAAYLEAKRSEFEATSDADAEQLWAFIPDLWPVFEAFHAQHPHPTDWSFSMQAVTNGWDSFERLRIVCHLTYEQPDASDELDFPLRRVLRACTELKYILQGIEQRFGHKRPRGPLVADWSELVPKTREQLLRGALHDKQVPPMLRPHDFRTVRKIWELGTEPISVQTSVQVDGDVVTRIASHLLDDHSEQIRELVLATHKESVSTGLTHWRFLVETARALVSNLLTRLRVR